MNELLEDQFLVVSDDYGGWVNTEEERNVLGGKRSGEPPELAETFLTS